jgi:hypothetical protein
VVDARHPLEVRDEEDGAHALVYSPARNLDEGVTFRETAGW